MGIKESSSLKSSLLYFHVGKGIGRGSLYGVAGDVMMVSEYDAFGPWIYEVSDEHPLPPLFVPFYKEGGNCLMLIKIPRNIERRNARPDMDLYDYVVGLYEDHIYIMKRQEKHVEESRALYGEIVGIEVLSQLLAGTLTIYMANNKIMIPFNTVSGDVVTKLAGIIRSRYAKKTYEEKDHYCFENNLNVDVLYRNLLSNMKSNERNIRICAVQRSVSLELENGNLIDRIWHFITGRKLLNTLHLTNNRELIIISRGRTFREGSLANYDYAVTYLPFEKLRGVFLGKYDKYAGLVELNLKLSGQDFKFYFEQTNKESIRFYNDLSFCSAIIN